MAPGVNADFPPDFTITINGGGPFNWDTDGGDGQLWDWGQYSVPDDPDTWEGWCYTGESSTYSGVQWNIVFNSNTGTGAADGSEFVTANFVVTNNDPFNTQNFSLLMTLPVAPIADPMERGSIVGTVTSNVFMGSATVSAPVGSQIYTPRIDTVDEAPGFLMNDPYSQSASFPNSAVVGPEEFDWVASSQPIDDSIAIFLSFDLTPSDGASFTAIFEVAPIPGPGALPLLLLGLLGGRRRRD
jgi:hypothetical protein